jgi:Fe-S oxidoreductase
MASSCAAASSAICGELGFDVQLALADSHLCCGSAGTYSVLQPEAAPPSCATASWRQPGAEVLRGAGHRVGQRRLHPAPAERHRHAGATCTGWKCWTTTALA